MAVSTRRPVVSSGRARELVLRKQHLLARIDPDQWHTVPRSLVGVHAARFKSPIHSLSARIGFRSKEDAARRLYGSTDTIKIRCMRGTLHIAPVDLAETLHSATWRQRKGVCDRMIRACGADARDVDAVREAIGGLLTGSALTALEIETDETVARVASRPLARAVLKLMWESGALCYVNGSGAWAREERRYATTLERYGPDALQLVDEAEAETELMRHYLAAYGPATVADAAWWSGLGAGRVARALGRIKGVVEVEVSGESGRHLMVEADLDELATPPEDNRGSIRLLAWEDNLLKGYMPSRRRFVDPRHLPKVFNAIGEARATIASAGRVVGTWTWNQRHSRPEIDLFRDLEPDEQRSLTYEIERLVCLAAAGT